MFIARIKPRGKFLYRKLVKNLIAKWQVVNSWTNPMTYSKKAVIVVGDGIFIGRFTTNESGSLRVISDADIALINTRESNVADQYDLYRKAQNEYEKLVEEVFERARPMTEDELIALANTCTFPSLPGPDDAPASE